MSLHGLIRSTIRAEIADSVYSPGERLPGVAELCARFDAGTATVVRAMRSLAAEGVLDARHGDGYYAAVAPLTHDDLIAELDRAEASLARARSIAHALSTPASEN